jgi:hypothetical protein
MTRRDKVIGSRGRLIVVWLMGIALALAPVYSRISAAQSLPDQASPVTVSAVKGAVPSSPARQASINRSGLTRSRSRRATFSESAMMAKPV